MGGRNLIGGSRLARNAALATLVLMFALGERAAAQLSSAAGNASGSTCSGSDADGFCGFSAGLTVNTSTTITSRHAWNINADIGIFSTRDVSGSGQHNVTFNATAVGGYRLDISTSRLGDLNRVNDAAGCDGSADTSGITGSSNIPLNSGTLSLADPGQLATSGDTGSSPFNQSSSAIMYRVSNGVAQAHSLTFTWNGSVRSNSCEVAVRQGLANGSTTGCSACEYPGSPSRTQSSDGHFVTVTYTSLCGNGIIDGVAGEQCDQGGANGTSGSCCTSTCQNKLFGTVCRNAAGVCDVAETCTGASGACPIDFKKPSGTGCRIAAGQCDVDEVCDGVSNNCPADGFVSSSVACRAGSAGEVCDITEFCPGNGPNCPADAVKPNGTLCRAATSGGCDVAENCDGTAKFCPVDGFKMIGTVCRASAGVCDVAEVCTGMGPNCPANGFEPNTTVCRAAAGVCDLAETCPGNAATCPADAKSSAVCRAASGVCDVAESCDGVSNNCPADGVRPNGFLCRASAGICDVAENCDGVGKNCPANTFQPSSVECRASAGVCDVAENCTGSGAACPPDTKSTAQCNPSNGVCDVAENCDGVGDNCPADAVAPSGTTCRPAADTCDAAEVCDGVSIGCPADAFQPSGAACPDALFCNGAEICDGNNNCIDQADPCPIICAESLDACLASGCPPAALPGCKTAAKNKLLIKNKLDDSKDKLVWKWLSGQSTIASDFADPESTANYALCIYTGTVAAQIDIPPNASKWDPISNKGYKYFDASAIEDGAQKVTLKGSSTGRSKILVKGRGQYLPDPINMSALGSPVKVQLVNHQTGKCWESTFLTYIKNTTAMYKAKSP